MNKLYFGDNLTVLREHIAPESIDLIYLDPPFNSQATYNVLFGSGSGQKSEAQAEAFRDTWEWGDSAAQAYEDIRAHGGDVSIILSGLRRWLGENAMMAYLAMMSARLLEMRATLKPTGSLYLHCDSTASHYLKLILDSIFGHRQYLNEIIWQRTGAHNDARRFGRVTDSILFYSKTGKYNFTPQYTAYADEYIAERYRYIDETSGRRFWSNTATSPSPRPNMMYEWKGQPSPPNGWRFERPTMERLERENRLYYSKTGMVYVKNYLDEQKGRPAQNLWTDVVMSKSGAERLGYPTQKPTSLLNRIISASSNPGDIILDPFCGCGTSIDAAEGLGRRWIGIDVTHYAVTLIERRLKAYHPTAKYSVHGRPTDLAGAVDLARRDKHQFQWWAAWLLGAQRYREEKKGSDRGVDGRALFKNGPYGDGLIVISVKGGENLGVQMVRDLRGVIERDEAEMGVLVTLAEPTRPMISEAAAAGFVRRSAHGRLPRLQVVTVGDLLDGRLPVLPPLPKDTESAPRPTQRKADRRDHRQTELLFTFPGGKDDGAEFTDPRFVDIGDARVSPFSAS
jgi:adenine specific DNA methylase Mod